MLIVKERPPSLEKDISRVSEMKVTTWCCTDQGTSRIEVKFSKNTFEPNEKVHCDVIINNSKCNVAM